MKRLMIAAALCAVALSGCDQVGAVNGNGTAAGATVGDQVVLKSTTALSLAELAFISAEQAATAALKSPSFTTAQKAVIGDAVLEARGYREQAREAVAKGQDAGALLTSLSGAIANINILTTNKGN